MAHTTDNNPDKNTTDSAPTSSTALGETSVATGGNTTRISWPHLYLGMLGFAISLYALRVHNQVAGGGESGCGFTESVNCDSVLASEYAKFLGIPLGVFGMAYFIVVIITGITTNPRTTNRQAALWRLLVMSVGVCGSLTLTYISLVKIRAACPVCLATHAVVLTLFVVSLVQFLKVRRRGIIEV